jgi:hypothetical protein
MASLSVVRDGDAPAGRPLDAALAREALCWIAAVTGEAELAAAPSFGEALRNGCALVRLARALAPEHVAVAKPYVKGASKFKEMENVTRFIRFCRDVGVPESDNFTTVALYEMTGLDQVCTCLHSLGRVAQTALPHFKGPTLGVKLATANKRNFTLEQRLASKGATSKWTMGNNALKPKAVGVSGGGGGGGGGGVSSGKPGFSRHDRKRSTEMNTFPCNSYKLDMKADKFGACVCGFSRGAHGLKNTTEMSQERAEGSSTLLSCSPAGGGGPSADPCGNFTLDMTATTFGMCTCGHLRTAHAQLKKATESQQALKTLGQREKVVAERKAKRAAEKAVALAKAEPTQGWVTKRGQLMPTWKKRWFVFEDGILAYKTRKGGKIKGQLLIPDCLVTVQYEGLGFGITIPGRTMLCKCETRKQAAKWIAVLRGDKRPDNTDVEDEDAVLGGGGEGESKLVSPGKQKKKKGPEFNEPTSEVLEANSGTTLFKSVSVGGNLIQLEVEHAYPRKIMFTTDVNGSTNLKLRDALSGKRTAIVQPRRRTRVALLHAKDPQAAWSLSAKYAWEVEMAP